MENTVRWSLKVARETDQALRAHLGQAGGRKGDLSRFIQEAVRQSLGLAAKAPERMTSASRVRARTGLAAALAEIRGRTQTLSHARFEKLVSEAVAYARKRR